jgi:DNA-directed RNA polymerase subunit K/omega
VFFIEVNLDNYKLNPVLVRMKESDKGLIYQSIVAMGKRSRQINDLLKMELQERMSDIIVNTSDSDSTNFDQIRISREFDKRRKPTFIAMQEIFDDKLRFVLPEANEDSES